MVKFYGVLEDVIVLSYTSGFRCVLFNCKWFDLDRNKPKKIDSEFTSINVSRLWYENEPNVLANQVTQAFYVNDTKLWKNWNVVQSAQRRHLIDPSLLQFTDGNDPNVSDAYQQQNCIDIEVLDSAQEVGLVAQNDEATIEIEIAEKIVHSCVDDDDDAEEDWDEEDDTCDKYWSSKYEATSQAYDDSDLD
ncbi:hypothetical protein K2173_006994 [Erythroxylum novogranatense]|uniref:DUF4216 domain-containing protein n=1 Tax=Erythroxylum novogranatense TaxID=1862640 RepID=A0AAV8SZG1_9ROSI|nr:hypothetical protein K2173_006994 [Erythroxylum novogranatense]